jgi:hypothetical protein
MGLLDIFKSKDNWTLASAARSGMAPRADGGLSFTTSAAGALQLKYLYVKITLEGKKNAEVLTGFKLLNKQKAPAGKLINYGLSGRDGTLVFEGDWNTPERLILQGLGLEVEFSDEAREAFDLKEMINRIKKD